MSKENIYSKRVDSFQGYLRFHGNVSIKFLHKKRRKRKIFLQVTQEIVFLLNYRKIIYNFCQVYYSNYDILRVTVVEVGLLSVNKQQIIHWILNRTTISKKRLNHCPACPFPANTHVIEQIPAY